MALLKIKNFGPIKDGLKTNDGFININRFTVFIGEQGSGKSTVAKLYSTLCWLEKDLARNAQKESKFQKEDYKQIETSLYSSHQFPIKSCLEINSFKNLLENQNIPTEYLKNKEVEISYKGDFCDFLITYNHINIKKKCVLNEAKGYFANGADLELLKGFIDDSCNYVCPKITYIPSERNILTTIKNIDSSQSMPLFWTKEEIGSANSNFKNINNKKLFNKFAVYYNEKEDINYIGVKGGSRKITIRESSSGLQSYLPVYLIINNSNYMVNSDIVEKISKSKELISNMDFIQFFDTALRFNINMDSKGSAWTGGLEFQSEVGKKAYNSIRDVLSTNISKIDNNTKMYLEYVLKSYLNSRYICIIEEPEQNLFPSSQIEVLDGLIESTSSPGSKCIVTTHSPYLLSYLNNYIYAGGKYEKESDKNKKKILKSIGEEYLLLKPNQISAYELKDGEIKDIFDKKSNLIMSDAIDSYFEKSLIQYDKLLEI